MSPTTYTVQTWQDQRRVTDDLTGLSIDAAREIAFAHRMAGFTARIMSDDDDYCEVYAPGERRRTGTFAQTTRVHGAA